MRIFQALIIASVLVPMGGIAAEQNDLREFRIGLPVTALPATGYGGFACAAEPTKKLSGWADYRSCPLGPDGTAEVSFRYGSGSADDPDGASETLVAGQPVVLALQIDKDARVSGIRISTDPQARLYLHKKAFLFALQVRARFGEDGWNCRKISPTPTEQPVGGVFFHEHCEKVTPSRHYVLDRQLFRDPGKDLRDFTDATQLTILGAGA